MSCREVVEVYVCGCVKEVGVKTCFPGQNDNCYCVPTGGVVGQVLTKHSNTNGDFGWENQVGGSGGGKSLYQEGPLVVTSGDIANGYITVSNALVDAVNSIVHLIGGPDLLPNVDYTWTATGNRLNFSTPLKSRLIVGDVFYVRRLAAS